MPETDIKSRFETIRMLFDKEEKRRDELVNRIKIYLSIFTFYLGAIAFSLKDITQVVDDQSLKVVFISCWGVTLIFLVLPFFFIIRAFNQQYMYPNQLTQMIESGEIEEASDNDYYYSRIIEMVLVHENNVAVNDTVSRNISFSLKSLFVGIIGSVLLFILSVI